MLLVIIAALPELAEGAYHFMDRHRLAEYTAQIHQELVHRVTNRSSSSPFCPSPLVFSPRKVGDKKFHLEGASGSSQKADSSEETDGEAGVVEPGLCILESRQDMT